MKTKAIQPCLFQANLMFLDGLSLSLEFYVYIRDVLYFTIMFSESSNSSKT